MTTDITIIEDLCLKIEDPAYITLYSNALSDQRICIYHNEIDAVIAALENVQTRFGKHPNSGIASMSAWTTHDLQALVANLIELDNVFTQAARRILQERGASIPESYEELYQLDT